MPRAKSTKTEPVSSSERPPIAANGPPGEVLTLAEAAAYLRLAEKAVLGATTTQGLPGRRIDGEWRFLKPAIQAWLSQPADAKKDFWEACAGAFKDDPHLEEIVQEAHRQRGRSLAEDE